jgi:poly-gamma-glutamate synthesis protein (capsule biosynthesis protein)
LSLRALALAACAALFLAACSDDDESATGPAAGSPTQPPVVTTAVTPETSPSPSPAVSLIAAGDVMLGRSLGEGILANGAAWPFEFVSGRLAAADLTFVNLESPVSERGEPVNKDFTFRGPPAAIDGLLDAGVDIVSLANNHAYDYGPEALLDTLDLVSAAGIVPVGAGRDAPSAGEAVVLERNGLRIAFLAYVSTPPDSGTGYSLEGTQATADAPGVNWLYPERIPTDVAAAETIADVVVVSMHTGPEYQENRSDLQVQAAHAAIDAGAALVIGHHPHVLQGIESYNGGLILYSLGNFVFDFDFVDFMFEGLPSSLSVMAEIELTATGVTSCSLIPVVIGEADGRPHPVEGEAAAPVLDRLARLSDGSCGLGE